MGEKGNIYEDLVEGAEERKSFGRARSIEFKQTLNE
jgi:hypothetical protein